MITKDYRFKRIALVLGLFFGIVLDSVADPIVEYRILSVDRLAERGSVEIKLNELASVGWRVVSAVPRTVNGMYFVTDIYLERKNLK